MQPGTRLRTVRLSLPFSADAPTLARRGLAASPYVPDGRRDDLELLVSELVTNAVRHAETRGRDAIQVAAAFAPGEVRVAVRDGGTTIPAPRVPDDDGGFGLNIVDEVADEWGAGPGEVWFVLRSPGRFV
jgi:anti-sigma regulatory factor (Ser/Thr protein kinase)